MSQQIAVGPPRNNKPEIGNIETISTDTRTKILLYRNGQSDSEWLESLLEIEYLPGGLSKKPFQLLPFASENETSTDLSKPLVIDLFCGSFGWTSGFINEGWRSVGFDLEHHSYHGKIPRDTTKVLADVLDLHGSMFRNASCIVASPPCQEPSYRAMPWKRAKALNAIGPPHLFIELFNACFRIQREASEAAGHYIPLIVENVRGAQPWVGRSAWNYGSYHLWGDIPALMPIQSSRRLKFPCDAGPRLWKDRKIPRLNDGRSETEHSGRKGRGSWFGDYQEQKKNHEAMGLKQGGDWFGKGEACSMSRRFSSRSKDRKSASAEIAKIPFPLAQHIARTFKPRLFGEVSA
jgi:hypothetical protein